MEKFLPINEYSSKYKVSISTIRRRIRSKEIQFRMENGKYLVFDQAPEVDSRGSSEGVGYERYAGKQNKETYLSEDQIDNSFSSTHKLLEELKKAYSMILLEKEEQIIALKEEIADLRTLARVLENENARLQQPRAKSN